MLIGSISIHTNMDGSKGTTSNGHQRGTSPNCWAHPLASVSIHGMLTNLYTIRFPRNWIIGVT